MTKLETAPVDALVKARDLIHPWRCLRCVSMCERVPEDQGPSLCYYQGSRDTNAADKAK